MTYERLSLEEFGRQLILSRDLDPVYTALTAIKDENRMKRLLFAYWCCYDLGESAFLSHWEGYTYWETMKAMAANAIESPIGPRWPRGRERRHFRGQKAVDAIEWFAASHPLPESIIESLETKAPTKGYLFPEIRKKVLEWPQFGPWIAFKVGDMLERCLQWNIDFSQSDIFFFDTPRDASYLWLKEKRDHAQLTNLAEVFFPDSGAPALAVSFLREKLGHFSAPPHFDRPLNIQEYETILCKWKSHMNGIYPVGIDTKELKHSLKPWIKAGYGLELFEALGS